MSFKSFMFLTLVNFLSIDEPWLKHKVCLCVDHWFLITFIYFICWQPILTWTILDPEFQRTKDYSNVWMNQGILDVLSSFVGEGSLDHTFTKSGPSLD